MEHEIYMKPGEKTPRAVKNLIITAYLIYFLAGITFLMAILASNWTVWLKVAAFLSVVGLIIQQLIAKLVNWYISG